MRGLVLAIALAAAAVLGCNAGDTTGPESATTGATEAPTRAGDIELLLERIEEIHPDPYHAVSRDDFRRAADNLADRAGSLGADEFLVELMRLTALLGERDGHSGDFPLDAAHESELHLYPLRLYAFDDGLYVVGVVGDLDLVGARLLSIAGVPAARVAEAVAPLVPRDNDMSLAARLPQYVLVAEILHGLGLTDGIGAARFVFELADGKQRELSLEPISAESYAEPFSDLFPPMVPQDCRAGPSPLTSLAVSRTDG